MRIQQIRGIILLLVIITSAAIYAAATTRRPDPALQQAQIEYEMEKLQLKRENLKRYDALAFYGIAGLLGTIGLSLLLMSSGYLRAKLKVASVYIARVGQHSQIPVHYRDLQNFYPIAVNLSLAEIQASVSTSHDQAYQISRQMIEDITDYTRTFAGRRGLLPFGQESLDINQLALPAACVPTQTFAELLRNGMVAPGKELLLGYNNQGQPQYRSLKALKSVAIAGWQGSGKTLSTGYLIASSILSYGVYAYVVDPHKNHAESLYTLIKPLEQTGHVTVINPFDTPALIESLNQLLDRRLNGQEPNEPGILFVIDELARLAKQECFDALVTFLERCTEEIRKANITFLGSSNKWTARHFKGRADIRGCMNSMLIHKTKPSQADLLIEDARDKNLVKQLQQPGDAILVTDFDTPTLVSMPFCTREDMVTVAEMISNVNRRSMPFDPQMVIPPVNGITPEESQIMKTDHDHRRQTSSVKKANFSQPADESDNSSDDLETSAAPPGTSRKRTTSSDVIWLEHHRKRLAAARQAASDPTQLTVEEIRDQLQWRRQQDSNFTQTEVARRAGLSQSLLSRILNEQRPLTDEHKLKLYHVLFTNTTDLSAMKL